MTEDFEDLYEHAPCGYLSMQADGRISKANTTLGNWIGYAPAELTGRKLQDLLTIGTRIFYETHSAPLLVLEGHFNEVFLELKTAAGQKLPVFANAVERRDANGDLLFTRLTIFKASERARYERELISARDESRALEARTQDLLRIERETAELREQFIAVLGHDLRNPLAAISGGVNIIAKASQDEKVKRVVPLVMNSIQRMANLIDNVLDFARGRLGDGLTLTRELCDVVPILEQVVSELRAGHPERVIEMELALSEKVDCDDTRLSQLVSNLLANALTHGAQDKPVILRAATHQDVFELSVSNEGEPIPPAALTRLFKPFERGAVRPSAQGLGLGLYIATQIAIAHGGSLSATSTPQETRFTLNLPLR